LFNILLLSLIASALPKFYPRKISGATINQS
jgi:hypothetical protein